MKRKERRECALYITKSHLYPFSIVLSLRQGNIICDWVDTMLKECKHRDYVPFFFCIVDNDIHFYPFRVLKSTWMPSNKWNCTRDCCYSTLITFSFAYGTGIQNTKSRNIQNEKMVPFSQIRRPILIDLFNMLETLWNYSETRQKSPWKKTISTTERHDRRFNFSFTSFMFHNHFMVKSKKKERAFPWDKKNSIKYELFYYVNEISAYG